MSDLKAVPPPSPKPDCYACTYRRNLPGDAHSRCLHPSVPDDAFSETLAILAKRTGAPPFPAEIEVRFNPHGVRMGWAAWPWNFDPTWLEACEGFTPEPKVMP